MLFVGSVRRACSYQSLVVRATVRLVSRTITNTSVGFALIYCMTSLTEAFCMVAGPAIVCQSRTPDKRLEFPSLSGNLSSPSVALQW